MKKMHFFLKISRNIIRIPALVYILLYVLFIFLFAFFYYEMPKNSFYHSMSKYEYKYLKIEEDTILYNIKREIKSNFKKHYKSNVAIINNWKIDSEKISVSNLDLTDFPSNLKVTLGYLFKNDKNKRIKGGWVELIIDLNNKFSYKNMSLFPYKIGLENRIIGDSETIQKDVRLIVQYNSDDLIMLSYLGYFPIRVDLDNDIRRLGNANQGFPSEVPNHYSRMLYFSASLATSNGLGDIVPITNKARLIVTIESIVMLLLITLFLSSLAEKLGRKE